VTKTDFFIIAALAAGCLIWIEQGHRVVIDPPTPSELEAAAATCPLSDHAPYSAGCIRFMSGESWRAYAAPADQAAASHVDAAPSSTGFPCPDRDNVPYSDACLAYLQGATSLGMAWRIKAPTAWAVINEPPAAGVAKDK
jgi:hypothetical protein